ncbi:hypothetical protein SEA_EYRE_50 [Gordonia phage Eyre]|uniref:Uncharacterized protein n=1 Tax=Gordonia phage Eyre TaxID=1887646 RepID=A0A1B3AZX9_9CAUD|nr:hypothetical protein BIZ73_gp50 [Gordonia phage Eyre]AOE44330.1 hypothetical protein SEA_EYRE_50 [Gordonia phage Eyre]
MSAVDDARRDLASDAAFLDGTSVFDAPGATYRLRTWVQTRIPALLAELGKTKTVTVIMRPAMRRSLIEGLRGRSEVQIQLPNGVTIDVSGDRLSLTIPGATS